MVQVIRRRRYPVGVILCAALCAGCASGHATRRSADWVLIEVRNDLVPASAVVVHIVGDGRRVLLGDVPPARTRQLQFRQSQFRGSYSLLANAQRAAVTLQTLTLRPGDHLYWQLRSNLLRIEGRAGDGPPAAAPGRRMHVAG